VFTSPGGSNGPGGPLARNNFWRVWNRALRDAKLAHLWPEYGGVHFHDLRHTHATWLLARRVPLVAVANRLSSSSEVLHVTRSRDQPEPTGLRAELLATCLGPTQTRP
jgi:integrase